MITVYDRCDFLQFIAEYCSLLMAAEARRLEGEHRSQAHASQAWLQRGATLAQTALLSLTSTLTSFVLMCFVANFLISLIALGARFLKEMSLRRLCRLMVYSRVTTSLEWSFFTICTGHNDQLH